LSRKFSIFNNKNYSIKTEERIYFIRIGVDLSFFKPIKNECEKKEVVFWDLEFGQNRQCRYNEESNAGPEQIAARKEIHNDCNKNCWD
jgi:hypothetical protein